ncbi:hypothetical protein MSG28_001392 [Choristoneura fumiferana]|uniref:Uncharacterized protein n=1 Tax=Choristoneura fumiferana TaxID=7141 RepID=A0ACC0KUU5_CHOFU|nr:hypothetical protein MSG28_001392 [Choristoneura fumiferana]
MSSASEPKSAEAENQDGGPSVVREYYFIVNSISILVIIVCSYILLKRRFAKPTGMSSEPQLPKMRKDMTIEELRKYDGTQPDGRVLVAVNGWIFDATRGRRFYGPGGPYATFGGRDASRGLATFSVTSTDDKYDDLSDLNSIQMDSVKEWEAQFREKYDLVGRLLKPGEEPTNYDDSEFEDTLTESSNSSMDKKDN